MDNNNIQNIENMLTILDEKFKTNPELKTILWNMLIKHFQNINDIPDDTTTFINDIFGEPVGDTIEEFLFYDTESKEIIENGPYEYRDYFISLISAFSEEAFRRFLYSNYGPTLFYSANRVFNGKNDELRIIRTDKKHFDIKLDSLAYSKIINMLLMYYTDHLSRWPRHINELNDILDTIDGLKAIVTEEKTKLEKITKQQPSTGDKNAE